MGKLKLLNLQIQNRSRWQTLASSVTFHSPRNLFVASNRNRAYILQYWNRTVHCGLPTTMVTALFDSVVALGYSNHIGHTSLLVSFVHKMKLWHANLSFSSRSKDETCFRLKIPYSQFIISMCNKYFYSWLFQASRNQQCNQHSNVISARRDFMYSASVGT